MNFHAPDSSFRPLRFILSCEEVGDDLVGPMWRRIARQVAWNHDVSVDALLGPTRGRTPVCRARFELYYRLRAEFGMTIDTISFYLGRTRSAVINGIRRHCADLGQPIPTGFRMRRYGK